MPTPEFLVWAIEEPCPLRQIAGFENPERTERHLRTLRAYSDAAAERRIFEGICFEPAADPLKGNGKNGFRVADALSLYGGLKTAEESCCKCPANALKQTKSRNLAGCFGMVPLPAKETEVHSAVEAAIDRLGLRANVKASFSSTTPAWYGLWMRPVVDAPRALLLKFILRAATIADPACRSALADLISGLSAAWERQLPLRVTLYPRGEVNGTWWTLVSHCQECKAPWPEAKREQCEVCNYRGHPASPPKRRARGTRPYWPLERMLGREKAEEFLVRYQEYRSGLTHNVHPTESK